MTISLVVLMKTVTNEHPTMYLGHKAKLGNIYDIIKNALKNEKLNIFMSVFYKDVYAYYTLYICTFKYCKQ